MQTYEIRCAGRVVSHVKSFTRRHAVTEYLRSLGCRDEELELVGADEIAWRGAVYTAVETTETEAAPSNE